MTKAEACIWKFVLKGKQLKGYPFRRQRPVLQYIADFLCKELMLIIEIDGITHDHEEVILHDKKREMDLKEAGFKIIRFSDDEVLTNISGVAKRLECIIDDIKISTPYPRQRGTSRVEDQTS
jgi:very-short-patch-repair endonuclease